MQQSDHLLNWHNVATLIDWGKYYPTMGIDRIMVCEAIDDGVIVDAGSAITVDVMSHGVYQGGFISLGLTSSARSIRKIIASPCQCHLTLRLI